MLKPLQPGSEVDLMSESAICCARLAERRECLAIEEHSARLTMDHTAHLLPTAK
jgi:hypothetical protein